MIHAVETQTRTYSVLEEDSRGVSHAIAENLSNEFAHALIASGRDEGRKRTLIRERETHVETMRHPARGFLRLAICHHCGHSAEKHGPQGQACDRCQLAAYENDGDQGEPKCHRSREMVILDGLVDFAACDFSLRRAIADTNEYALELVVEPDPTGLGARLGRGDMASKKKKRDFLVS